MTAMLQKNVQNGPPTTSVVPGLPKCVCFFPLCVFLSLGAAFNEVTLIYMILRMLLCDAPQFTLLAVLPAQFSGYSRLPLI